MGFVASMRYSTSLQLLMTYHILMDECSNGDGSNHQMPAVPAHDCNLLLCKRAPTYRHQIDDGAGTAVLHHNLHVNYKVMHFHQLNTQRILRI